ncbi:MAG: hypothetical protein ACRCY3_03655 [Sphingorhabdus sp.]
MKSALREVLPFSCRGTDRDYQWIGRISKTVLGIPAFFFRECTMFWAPLITGLRVEIFGRAPVTSLALASVLAAAFIGFGLPETVKKARR